MVEFFTSGDVDDLVRRILSLYSGRSRLKQLSQGIKQFNQRYSWAKQAAEYVRLVEKLAIDSQSSR